ncbi:hypothetical protein SCHPADRAFT_938360 [Schizopora paradoxa]|uniref:Uncharacterized protein n=1 Tax=Schizopora paradoxa TaxID=27342 RepID=A0A0H2S2B8_9AGAM|nr:hypothetical protein SCHPADRAFT_938360 [Schizopora paradoxa]
MSNCSPLANGEISLLNNKVAGLEKELELERRKVRELQESSRERDKEYQKLKNQYDKIKRKALLAPNGLGNELPTGLGAHNNAQGQHEVQNAINDRQANKARTMNNPFNRAGPGVDIGAVVGGMEANGVRIFIEST